MKWFAEITDYRDNTPNGIYLLDDGKSKMYAFRPRGTGEIKVFRNPIRIDLRGRKFAINSLQFKTELTEPEPEGRVFKVTGSKGDRYTVNEVRDSWSCTCSGFRFRGECRHIRELS